MAGSIKGIIVEIGGDTSGLQKALSSINSATSSLSKELKGINSLLKLDPKNTELLSQKQEVLAENIEQTSKKLEELKKVQDEVLANPNNVSEENYRNLQREIINTENKLQQLQAQASKWTQAGQAIEEFGNKVTKISSKIDKLGSTLTTSLTLPVLAIGTAAVTTGNDFEKQMSRVQAIAGATKDELEKLTNQAIDLGASTSFSASEVASGMENLASAGFTTNEIIEAMPGLLDLAASSGAELATASEIAASAIRGFGIEADQAGHVADVFAEAAARTNAQTEDMGEAMKYVAPVAKTVGLSIEETAAAIGIMSDAGVKGSQAGTTLRGGLTRIVKPTKMVRDAMAELGVEFYDSNGKMKSLTEIIKTLQDHTKGLTDETKNQALAQIFGTEALSGMLALVNRGSDELADMTKSFEECDGAASEMADTMLDNTAGSLESLSGSLESAAIAIQKELAPYIKDLAEWIQDLVDEFTNLSDEEKENIIKTVALVATIGPALKIIGKLGTGIGNVSKGISNLSKLIGSIIPKITQTSGTFSTLSGALSSLGVSGAGAVAFFGAVAVGLAAYLSKQKEVSTEAIKLTQETRKQKEAFQELINTQNEKLAVDMQQIDKTEELWAELQKITDANGKVKKGYEERAKVITSALSDALGTEIKLNGNVVQGYKDIQKEIDNLIRKKKAEAIMTAQEDAYNEAFSARQDAYKTLLDIQSQIDEKQKQLSNASWTETTQIYNDIANLTNSLKTQQDLIKQYDTTIADYEYDQKLAATNTAESIEELVNRNAVSFQNDSNNLQQSGLDKLNYYATQLQNYKSYKQQEIDAGNEANTQMYQDQINANEKQLQLTADNLAKQITSVEDITPETVQAYKNIADYSINAFSAAISKLPPDVQDELATATGVINDDTSMEKASEGLAADVEQGFNGNVDGYGWGSDLTQTMANGMQSKDSWSRLTSAASTVASWISDFLHFSVPEKGPLSDMDKSMPDMIDLMAKGINQNKPKLIRATKGLAKSMDSTLNPYSSLENIPKMQKGLTNAVKQASNVNYNNMTNNFYVQELDKERLEQCFKYINKKYGIKY